MCELLILPCSFLLPVITVRFRFKGLMNSGITVLYTVLHKKLDYLLFHYSFDILIIHNSIKLQYGDTVNMYLLSLPL